MALYKCAVQMCTQDQQLVELSSEELVPGDIIRVPEGAVLPCDMILLEGSCVVDESVLTGESVPVMKASLSSGQDTYSASQHQKHTLFGGTPVIQIRAGDAGQVLALVTNTGFLTTKGSLVREILYPKETKFQFYRDGLKFILIMGVFAFAAFFGILPFMLQQEETGADVLANRVANLFVIAIPPALPAAMSSGMIFAIRRLKQQKIFCIAPQRVNIAGRITTFVFDKTGTLTEDSLSVQGYKFQQNERFSDFSKDFNKLLPQKSEIFATKCPVGREDTSLLFLEACASCTAITHVGGKLVGDTLDVRMFEATGWI